MQVIIKIGRESESFSFITKREEVVSYGLGTGTFSICQVYDDSQHDLSHVIYHCFN